MLKSSFFLFTCLMHFVCVDVNQEKTKAIAKKKETKTPILWTADWNPNGKLIAIGGDDKVLRIYEANNYTLYKSYELKGAVQSLDWNIDGKLLAIGIDDNPVQLLNIEAGDFVELKGPGSRAVAWNYNGQLLGVGDYEGNLQIWNNKGNLVRTIKKEQNKTYLSIDWHPTRNIILTGGDKIRLFDTSGNMLLNIKHRVEETILLTVKWHPGGAFFATGDYGHKEEEIESLLQFWKEDGTLIKSLSGSKAEYRNIRWNKDGSKLATASDALRIWSKDGAIIYTGETKNLLWGIDWNNQNDNIVTTSEKGDIWLWTDKAKLVKIIP